MAVRYAQVVHFQSHRACLGNCKTYYNKYVVQRGGAVGISLMLWKEALLTVTPTLWDKFNVSVMLRIKS